LRGSNETRVGFFVLAAIAVFIYMGFQTGAFRFDAIKYNTYTVYFKDIAGLARKGDVKIAGVKVGWVKHVALIPDDHMQAQAHIMILKEYALYADAYAIVRQDGLLGPRYVEIIPGNPLSPPLASGDQLLKPSTEPVSIDELLLQFKKIATNVDSVTESFKQVIGGDDGKERLNSMVASLSNASDRLSSFAQMINQSFERNERNIDTFLETGGDIKRVVSKFEDQLLPALQTNMDRIATVFDRDFDRVASKFESAAESLEEASVQARDGLHNVSLVAEKINEGKGLIGKLVNEEETYRDVRVALQGLKNYVTKIDRLHVVVDTHFESMHCRAENYRHEDSKGYFDLRIYPSQDHFYQVGIVSSEKGFVDRVDIDRKYYNLVDENCRDGLRFDVLSLPPTELTPSDFLRQRIDTFKRNTLKLDLQFGKIFGDLSLRFGLFEGTAGLGADINIPFCTDKFSWVTTFEAFDFRGWNRKGDRRPHLKWLNRTFLFNSIYLVFGADDFVSKHNASVFFGAGMRFGDEEVKYLMSNIAGLSVINHT